MTYSLARPLQLTNGMTLIVEENPAADIVAARIFLRFGGRWETKAQAGISHLLSAVLTKGTRHLSAMAIAEQVESVGANLGTDASADYFVLSIKTVTQDFPAILQLARAILREPSFPEEQVELEKQLTLQSIRAQQERPFTVAYENLRSRMYGDHPYGRSILGLPETVAQLTAADLRTYHQTFCRPDNIVVSLCGNLTTDRAIALITENFQDWQAPDTPLPLPPVVTLPSEPQSAITPQDTQQSILMLGHGAPAIGEQADYLRLKLLNTYLGNGLSSRLFVELREKRGLAYDVSAFYPTRCERSQFVTYIGTAPENTAIAHQGLQEELTRLCDTPLSEVEVQTAKNKLLGQYALGKQTNAEISQLLGWYEILGLGIDFDRTFPEQINQITPQELQHAAQKYLGSSPYLSVVGPAAAVQSLAA